MGATPGKSVGESSVVIRRRAKRDWVANSGIRLRPTPVTFETATAAQSYEGPVAVPRPLRTQSSFGNYVSAQLGEGIEPGEIRPFLPGDRTRRINWRASLRRQQLYVTQYQEERNADVQS